MSKDILVYSCCHADPTKPNDRANWLGEFIYDIQPDIVVDLGDGADMRSMNAFDENKPVNLVSQNYSADIEAYNDFQERLRSKFKRNKRKKPTWIGMEGNHENRIKKYLSEHPRLEGETHGVSFRHLQTAKWFDEYYEYKNNAPAIVDINCVSFSHFFTSGNSGAATSGLHHAYTVINNRHKSSVCGHSHKRNLYFKDGANSIGMVVGCYKGFEESWAGQSNNEWWHGCVLMRDVEDGMFEPQFYSLDMLRKEYG